MGAIKPPLTMTRGLVESWNVSRVIHSGPSGSRSERSYCALVSNGYGSRVARNWSF